MNFPKLQTLSEHQPDIPYAELRRMANVVDGLMKSGAFTALVDSTGIHIRQGLGRGGNPQGLFAVKVWRDGGTTDGDATNAIDRTYKVRTIDATAHDTGGELLGIELTPEIRVWTDAAAQNGKWTVAPSTTVGGSGVVGIGYLGLDGIFVLWHAAEMPDTSDCS